MSVNAVADDEAEHGWVSIGEAAAKAQRHAEKVQRARAALDLCVALGMADRRDALQVCAGFLEAEGTDQPEWSDLWGDARREAEWWADFASPVSLETYFAAILTRMSGTAFGVRARKRLFAMLWESFAEADRQAFVARVDPAGRFRGRAG